ncbi:hypothetical protein CPB86DRAFT_524095 [Serendipita vermifera]|nr:hypothetical protein CPB86DRAFT_524095 [Serendipita vermifera]
MIFFAETENLAWHTRNSVLTPLLRQKKAPRVTIISLFTLLLGKGHPLLPISPIQRLTWGIFSRPCSQSLRVQMACDRHAVRLVKWQLISPARRPARCDLSKTLIPLPIQF